MSNPYTPQPDSLASQCVGFFRNNPDETLTLDDITDKFGKARGNIHTLLAKALEAGLLKRDRDEDGDYIYCAGVELRAVEAPQPEPAAPPPAQPAAPRANARVHIDLDALQVEEGVPFLPYARPGESKWQPLFDRLTRPNQSIVIPGRVKAAVAAAIMKRNKQKGGTFRIAMIDKDQARVWRIA